MINQNPMSHRNESSLWQKVGIWLAIVGWLLVVNVALSEEIPPAPPLASENLILNGSFEEFAETKDGREMPKQWGWDCPWFALPKDKGLSEISLDKTIVHGGTRALRIQGYGNRGLVCQTILKGFTPGDTLRLTGWVRREGMDGDVSVSVECGQGSKPLPAVVKAYAPAERGLWKRLDAIGRVPEGATHLFVAALTGSPNDGTVWFDDIELRKEVAPGLGAKTVNVSMEKSAAPTAADCVVPLDDFFASKSFWASAPNYYAGGTGKHPNRIQVLTENGDRFLRIEYGEDRAAGRSWNYFGEWTAMTLRARRIAGAGNLTLTILAPGKGFYNSRRALELGTDWREFTVLRSEFCSDSRPNETLPPVDLAFLRLLCQGNAAATIDVSAIHLAVPETTGIHTLFTDDEQGVCTSDRAPVAHASLFNTQPKIASVRLSFILRNYRGQTLKEGKQNLELAPRSCATVNVALPKLGDGYYSLDMTLHEGTAEHRQGLGLFVMPPRPTTKIIRPVVGGSSFGDLYPDTARLWMHRMEIPFWAGFTKDKEDGGIEVAQFIEDRVRACHRDGITPIGYLFVHPSHDHIPTSALIRSTTNPQNWVYKPQAFEEYAYKIAMHFRNDIQIWSFCGEIDGFKELLEGGIDSYVAVVQAGARGVRRAIPNAKVYSINVGGYNNWHTGRGYWQKLASDLDGMFGHNYPSGWTVKEGMVASPPESFLDMQLRQAVEFMGPGKKIGVQEAGYQLDPEVPLWHPLTRLRAEYAARSALIVAGIPQGEEYMFYTLHKRNLRDVWGMALSVDGHLNPDPGIATYATVARMLWNATNPVRLKLHNDIWSYVYRLPKGSLAVLWSSGDGEVSFALDGLHDFKVYDADGATITLKQKADSLALSGSPLYLEGRNISPEVMCERLRRAKFSLPLAKEGILITNADRAGVVLFNQTAHEVRGTCALRWRPVGGDIHSTRTSACTIPADGTTTVPFALALPTHLPAELDFMAEFTAKGTAPVLQTQRRRFWPVHKLAREPVIDGDLREYQGITPIVLDQAKDIFPPDAITAHHAWSGPEQLSARAWTTWNEKCFYFAAEVTDAVHVQQFTGEEIWQNDAVHTGFDMGNDTLPPQVTGRMGHDGKNDFEIGLALTKIGPQAYEWYSGAAPSRGLLKDAQLAIRRIGTKTLYEYAIPWKELGWESPAPHKVFGFSFVVMNSNDGTTAYYWLNLTRGICAGKDPSLYDAFVLEPE